jgi:hypothetical protein
VPAQQVVDIVLRRPGHLARHFHLPRTGPQAAGVLRRIGLVGAELVEVVVPGHVLPGRELVVVGPWHETIRNAAEGQQRRRRSGPCRLDELAAAPIERFLGDFRGFDRGGTSDQHVCSCAGAVETFI